jgi:hypothetical protein
MRKEELLKNRFQYLKNRQVREAKFKKKWKKKTDNLTQFIHESQSVTKSE